MELKGDVMESNLRTINYKRNTKAKSKWKSYKGLQHMFLTVSMHQGQMVSSTLEAPTGF